MRVVRTSFIMRSVPLPGWPLMKIPATLCLCCVLASPAWAADADGRLNVLSMGIKSCADVVADYATGGVSKLMNSVWVAGYLTAINSDVFDGFDIAEGMEAEARDAWISRYCAEHPEHTLYHATSVLVVSMQARSRPAQ